MKTPQRVRERLGDAVEVDNTVIVETRSVCRKFSRPIEPVAALLKRSVGEVTMKHLSTIDRMQMFAPLIESADVQAATMTLQAGESSSVAVENEHPHSEQWVFVVSGFGKAEVSGRTLDLSEGSLLLIEKNEPHRITNTNKTPMVTLNFYCPPAYTKKGAVRSQ